MQIEELEKAFMLVHESFHRQMQILWGKIMLKPE